MCRLDYSLSIAAAFVLPWTEKLTEDGQTSSVLSISIAIRNLIAGIDAAEIRKRAAVRSQRP